MMRKLLLSLFLVANACAPAVQAPRAAAAQQVGLNSHLLTPDAIAQLTALGVTHVRTTLLWPLWEENYQMYRTAFAENVARADKAGLKLLVVVHNWPGDRPVFKSGADPRSMRRFADFVAARARQFPEVEAWQLWNEQDVWWQAPFGASLGLPMRQRGRLYAEQLRLAYPAIKRANPRALVVSGGTAEHPDSGFLAGMMENPPPVDAIAIHAYGDWETARQRMQAARRIVGSHAPIWVTEAGADAEDRAHLGIWQSVIRGNAREHLAARIYPYALQAGGAEAGLGLLRADGRTQRPAFRWLRGWIRGEQ